MARKALWHRVKSHQVYTVREAAILLGRSERTIRRWIKTDGLNAITDQRPWLIEGRDLKEFLENKVAERRVSLGTGEMYCFRCRAARRPALGLFEYVPRDPVSGHVCGFCETCDCLMHRAICSADLPDFEAA